MSQLTSDDLGELVNILEDAKADWDAIAIQLKLPEGEIKAISRNCQGDVGRCLRESIWAWLKGIDPLPTRECLVAALVSRSVRREDLAMKILPNYVRVVPHESLKPDTATSVSLWKYVMFPIILAVAVSSLLYYYQHGCFCGRSFNLPVLKQELVGREREMKVILDYFDDAEVDVVTLFGQAGFGKSEVAKHVGHRMIEMGVDVYFISVEGCADIQCLEQTLMAISGTSYTNMRVVKWAEGLTRKTTLILDNVDGRAWVEDISRQQFQATFLDALVSHSSVLQVLITSQQEIRSKYTHRFRSYQLSSLSVKSCVHLVNISTTQGPKIARSESEVVCELVGNVPLAVKVLAAIMSPPVNCSVSYIVKRLTETSNKLKFMASSANRVDKDRLLSAFNLAFEFIKPEFQICSLLLVKVPGSFSLDIVSNLITPDMMKDHFYVEECLFELSSKSFLELISFKTLLVHNQKERYHFHVLIKDFLNNLEGTHSMTELLETFWKNYVSWLSSDSGEAWLLEDLGKQDLDALTHILDQHDPYSYSLAASLSSSRLVLSLTVTNSDVLQLYSKKYIDGRLHYQKLLSRVASILVSDCEVPGFNYPFAGVAAIIKAYTIAFEEIICQDSESLQVCMDKLILCQPKIEELHSFAKGDHAAMEASSYFHNSLVDVKCLETKNSHVVCKSAWKYRLLGLAHMLASVRDQCVQYCKGEQLLEGAECRKDVNTSIVLGLEFYSLLEDDKAKRYLHATLKDGSSSSCRELHNFIAYMALYVIHSRQGDLQGMDDSLSGILTIDLEQMNMTCHTAIYGDVVIPFLLHVNETVLAKKLRDIRIDSYLEAIGNCEGHPLNCQHENRYKTPMLKTLVSISPLWVKEMLISSVSLFCSISKEVMTGCESPFPPITDILYVVD